MVMSISRAGICYPMAAFVAFALFAMGAPASPDVSGTWTFINVGDRFLGTIVLQQSGSAVTGVWHTEAGKSEPDSPLSGRIDGNILYFTRSLGNLEQKYVLTISTDGNRIDGFGDGWGISHANLNMTRVLPHGADLSGAWTFRHVGGSFRGTITLRQSGSVVTGAWHTETGKSEPDSPLSGRVDGNTLYLTRSVKAQEPKRVLTACLM